MKTVAYGVHLIRLCSPNAAAALNIPALEGFMDEMIGDKARSVEEAGRLLIERVRPTSLLAGLLPARRSRT